MTLNPLLPIQHARGVYVASTADDFLPFPAKSLHYRGLNLSRSSLFRLREAGEIRTKEFRVTGGLKGRTFILRESLDAWIARELARPERPAAAGRTANTAA